MASKAFEAGVRKVFAPRLAELGFVRHGVRYFRPRPPWRVQGITLVQDKWNGTGFSRFSILVGRRTKLGWDPGKQVERAKADAHFFDTHAGAPSQPAIWLGLLTEARQDFQYDYPADDPAGIEAALNEALADIERYGLFWLRWGIRPFARRDPARAIAAKARFDAFLKQPPPGMPDPD